MEEFFNLGCYDAVGFDLDNTVCEYKVKNLVEMEYRALAEYFVEEREYPQEILFRPIEDDFFQRGLILDLERGNILRLREDGMIFTASHGTRKLSDEEILEIYPGRQWDVSTMFCSDMIQVWNGPEARKIRALLDYFDMPASLCFARAVDAADASSKTYKPGDDILAALVQLYNRDHFLTEKGKYFKRLKANPEKFLVKSPEEVVNWLKKIKEEKITFLLTGSNIDHASFTASYCLGPDWRDLFHLVVTYARKPGFFTMNRPFLQLSDTEEGPEVSSAMLSLGKTYSQGNWADLYSLLQRKSDKPDPKVLYFGDNLVQDIFTPSKYVGVDTIAVVEELSAEMDSHPSASCIASQRWGSFFREGDDLTIWGGIIKKHAKICVPSMKTIAEIPLDSEKPEGEPSKEILGFHPIDPLATH